MASIGQCHGTADGEYTNKGNGLSHHKGSPVKVIKQGKAHHSGLSALSRKLQSKVPLRPPTVRFIVLRRSINRWIRQGSIVDANYTLLQIPIRQRHRFAETHEKLEVYIRSKFSVFMQVRHKSRPDESFRL